MSLDKSEYSKALVDFLCNYAQGAVKDFQGIFNLQHTESIVLFQLNKADIKPTTIQ